MRIRGFLGRQMNNLKFRSKIVLIYILCVILPLTVISIYYYKDVEIKLKKQNQTDVNYAVDRTYYMLSNLFSEMSVISDGLYYNTELYHLLDAQPLTNGEKLENSKQIYSIIYAFEYNNSSESSIAIYTDNPHIYRSHGVYKINDNDGTDGWYDKFLSMSKNSAVVSYYDNERQRCIVSLIRKMDNLKMQYGNCFIKIDVSGRKIYETLKANSEKETMYLFDNNGWIISDGESAEYEEFSIEDVNREIIAEKKFDFPNDYKLCVFDGGRMKPDLLGGGLRVFIPLIALIALLSFMVITVVTRSFTGKLTELTECTEKIRNEEYETVTEENIGNDEIGMLTRGFNKAMRRIESLINDVYKLKINQVEIENERNRANLRALNSQINPHFMFNIIEVIRMKNYSNGDYETAAVMKNMSRMFRRLITWGDDLIPIKDELCFVNAYIEVQKYSADNDVNIDIKVDDAALGAMLPKMTIQVLVENAFTHGAESIMSGAKIELGIEKINDRVVISVADNGRGMTKQLVDAINSGKSENIKTKRIGLKNIISRLRLYFGSDYSLCASSVERERTEVIIEIPYKTNADFEKEPT